MISTILTKGVGGGGQRSDSAAGHVPRHVPVYILSEHQIKMTSLLSCDVTAVRFPYTNRSELYVLVPDVFGSATNSYTVRILTNLVGDNSPPVFP